MQDSQSSTPTTVRSPLPEALQNSLDRIAALLQAHAGHVPSRLLSELPEMRQAFGAQQVRIAICGEVKAGKSTLLNALAGADLSPVAFEPLTNVPVRVTYGGTTSWRVGGKTLEGLAELEGTMRGGSAATEVVVETNLDLLQLGGQAELLDTPGLGADANLDNVSAEALRTLDAVILVVRYPALFTELTRRLAKDLRQDISKLFVVWNLDASCRELSEGERERHRETLRQNLGMRNDVFFVDADRARRGRGGEDDGGLSLLTNALRAFLDGNSRQLVALRQVAKRGVQALAEAQEALATRQALVHEVIASAHRRLREIEAQAQSKSDGARTRRVELESNTEALVARSRAEVAKAAATLRQKLRAARRRWVWKGSLGDLETATGNAVEEYADAVARSSNAAAQEMQAGVAALGGECSLPSRPVTIPYVTELAPDGRGTLAMTGNWQVLRRAFWSGWYLEGWQRLLKEVISDDVEQQAQWLQSTREQAVIDANAATERTLAEIKTAAEAEAEQVREETDLLAYEAEATQLAEDIPALEEEQRQLTDLAKRARAEE